MRYFFGVCAVLLAFLLQGRISVLDIAPDLTVILAFYAGIRYGEHRGLLLGVLIGAIEDGMTSSVIGPNALAKGIVGFSSAFFVSGGLFRWTPLLGIIALFFFTFVENSFAFLARSIFDKMPAAPQEALFIAVMQSILNAPAGVLLKPKHVD